MRSDALSVALASGAPPGAKAGEKQMLKWILILLVVAAVAGLLGMNSLAGAAMTGAKVLIAIALILFLLVLFGLVAIA
jgi:uncharacterized membrane protein YtjA (UPF0391 family)